MLSSSCSPPDSGVLSGPTQAPADGFEPSSRRSRSAAYHRQGLRESAALSLTDAGGFPVGAAITTPKSILMGYGFETISTADQRKAVMGRIASYLLR